MHTTTVVTTGVTTKVTRGERSAFVTVFPTILRVPTMRGTQAHHGYVGKIGFEGQQTTCGCRFHQKRSGARACAVKAAKRMVRA